MNIDDAARATSSYFITRVDFDDFFVGTQDTHSGSFRTYAEAQIACDRMNLRAVLKAIREPNTVMLCAGVDADDGQTGIERIKHIHRAMIAALIAEVGK